ncbi:tRNA (adenosine(37)-N6)-threonylcarbamoyltransferase complex dimerization subunit type 1 TsaB [Flavobacterium sp.]|uniref:tRNA (adenosine(37)-N6)-threonylcarbamoyltransferase complex dimerization subunit type 1 TsaB n=1 Tax=Flavobacterium sp. TaxID=239 RepID=UPI0026391E6F|nr:tRNA (adenosine(37)-N6)-threonylcarbamoyltransferase complex dimerization subunit type 1 TsaB [Flavobacterium sp.]
MGYILNIETATKNCSVALAKSGETILCKEMAEQGFSHAEKLHLFIEEIIKEAGITFSDLSAIAVSQGPGSYTGLRIGVSAAKGLCYALEIPLISVDTLTVLANQLQIENGIIIPMIDARRMEVYSAIFNAKKEMIREVQAEILTDSSFSDIEDAVYFVGDSNEKAKTIVSKSNFNFVDTVFYPSANEMSAISYKKFLNNSFEDVAYFEPYYLKDFMLQTKST